MQLKDITTGSIVAANSHIAWVGGVWECGDIRFTDVDQTHYTVIPDVLPNRTILDPMEFKRMFTSPERIAIKASTDPVVQDFYQMVEDQLQVNIRDNSRGKIDLKNQMTIDALNYMSANPTNAPILAAGRSTTILAGVPA